MDPIRHPAPENSLGPAVRTALAICAAALLIAASGCASLSARKSLERVAKDWSETIRASQVIPVYPLTEDLVPGDVFLVQTTIQDQARIYRERGFLPLDDHRTRLKNIDYRKMYFDGYWKDDFGDVPHPRPKREPGPLKEGETRPATLTEADAPRAAFPTYSFEASSSGGLALALPIKGIPVGLDFLRTDHASGTVTIADARTYAADQGDLYVALEHWLDQPGVRPMLANTVKQTGRNYLFLRVVTRVYLTGSVVVSLSRAQSTGAGAKAGEAPQFGLLNPDGTVNENMSKLLEQLNAASDKLTSPLTTGGSVKFASASGSSVTMSESFDRLLVIGYLGFDVPLYAGGVLGAPIPTFENLEGRAIAPPPRVDVLSNEQVRFKIDEAALDALVSSADTASQGYRVMRRTIDALGTSAFTGSTKKLDDARSALGSDQEQAAVKAAFNVFKREAGAYVSQGGATGPRYAKYSDAFVSAFDKRDVPIE